MTPPRSRDGGSSGGGSRGGSSGGGSRGGSSSGGPRGGSSGGGPRAGDARSGSRGGATYAGSTKKSQPTRIPTEKLRPQIDVHDPDGVRLQKLLAAAGIGSRRACEQMIAEGRVEVDGQVVTELGIRVDPTQRRIQVDGVRVQTAARRERLFHVGRLDTDTEGLLLLTNDGELAHRLQHPKYGVPKTYVAQVPGPVARDLGRQLRDGIELEDGPVAVDSFRLLDSAPGRAVVEVVLHEGRKHIVRRMLEAVGHPVITLARVRVGPVPLGETRPGKFRPLTAVEVSKLYDAAEL